ncbi:MAG: hypothetical protein ACK5JT_04680, partial [Hyphomicrobiaceae bacterium]
PPSSRGATPAMQRPAEPTGIPRTIPLGGHPSQRPFSDQRAPNANAPSAQNAQPPSIEPAMSPPPITNRSPPPRPSASGQGASTMPPARPRADLGASTQPPTAGRRKTLEQLSPSLAASLDRLAGKAKKNPDAAE